MRRTLVIFSKRLGTVVCLGLLAAAAIACEPSAEFYQPPAELTGDNGSIYKSESFHYGEVDEQRGAQEPDAGAVPVPVDGRWVLYRSTNATGNPVAVSGTFLVPRT